MMTLPGSGGATGAAAAGSTATVFGDGAAASAVAAAVVVVADANDRAAGPQDGRSATGCTSASAATFARCTVGVSPFPDDGAGSDEIEDDNGIADDVGVGAGVAVPRSGLVGVTASGGVLVDALVDAGADETGALSSSSVAVEGVLADSAAAAGLVRWLATDVPCVVDVVDDGRVDGAVADSPGSCVEVDAPLEVLPADVLDSWLSSEFLPLLGEEELLGLSAPVPSA